MILTILCMYYSICDENRTKPGLPIIENVGLNCYLNTYDRWSHTLASYVSCFKGDLEECKADYVGLPGAGAVLCKTSSLP